MANTEEVLTALAQELSDSRRRPCLLLRSFLYEEDVRRAHTELVKADGDEIDVVIDSFGGIPNAGYVLARELRTRFKQITGFIPGKAKSTAALVTLAFDDLVFGELGELGPLDTQQEEKKEGDAPEFKSALNRFKALAEIEMMTARALTMFLGVLESRRYRLKLRERIELGLQYAANFSQPLMSNIDTYTLGESARALDVTRTYAVRILTRYRDWPQERADEVAELLVKSYPSHSYIIDAEELDALGFKARMANEDERPLLRTMSLAFERISRLHEFVKLVTPSEASTDSQDASSKGAELIVPIKDKTPAKRRSRARKQSGNKRKP